jgi:hypothetical protein
VTRPMTADMSDAQVREMPVELLGDALLTAGAAEDNARRGAVYALVNYGDYSLLRLRFIREYIVAAGTDGPLVQWSRLARHLADIDAPEWDATHVADGDPRAGIARMNTTARDALRLAVALGDTNSATNLRGMAGRFGASNRVLMAQAVAIAFGIRGDLVVPNHRAEPGA